MALTRTDKQAAKRIAALPNFEAQREAANEWTGEHLMENIYDFYKEINKHIMRKPLERVL